MHSMPFDLDDLLSDGQAALELFGLRTLARAVGVARNHLQTASLNDDKMPPPPSPLTGERVDARELGQRSWWQLPIEARQIIFRVIDNIEQDVQMFSTDEQTALIEAQRAAREVLAPDWRTSILIQLSTLAATTTDEGDLRAIERAQVALELGERPVFEGDGIAAPATPCDGCGAGGLEYCDPTKHPEVPGEG